MEDISSRQLTIPWLRKGGQGGDWRYFLNCVHEKMGGCWTVWDSIIQVGAAQQAICFRHINCELPTRPQVGISKTQPVLEMKWEIRSGGRYKLGKSSRNKESRERLVQTARGSRWQHVCILVGIIQERERKNESSGYWDPLGAPCTFGTLHSSIRHSMASTCEHLEAFACGFLCSLELFYPKSRVD